MRTHAQIHTHRPIIYSAWTDKCLTWELCPRIKPEPATLKQHVMCNTTLEDSLISLDLCYIPTDFTTLLRCKLVLVKVYLLSNSDRPGTLWSLQLHKTLAKNLTHQHYPRGNVWKYNVYTSWKGNVGKSKTVRWTADQVLSFDSILVYDVLLLNIRFFSENSA